MILINGTLTDEASARIDATDRGLLLGDGLFETVRSHAGVPFRLGAHLARLATGAKRLSIRLPLPPDQISGAITDLLHANQLQRAEAAIRVTLTRGPGPRGLAIPAESQPALLVQAVPYTPRQKPNVTAVVVEVRRNEASPTAQLKSLSYLDNVLAAQEAKSRGADDALMLNSRGRLACGARANLFLVLEETLYTPPLTEGALPGITRAIVLELAGAAKLRTRQSPVFPDDLMRASEVFLTNSLEGLLPVSEIGGKKIGVGEAGPVTRSLMEAYAGLAANRS
jgi:branched-chain amino acid aminotransferase